MRALICDPEKGSRQRLGACLQDYPLVEESIVKDSTDNLAKILEATESNLLFIDPLALELGSTSKLIFQIRECLPQVIICLYVRFSEAKRRTEEFYTGERERFGHYFRLDKELAGPNFEGETALLMTRCLATARNLSRNPRRVELITCAKYPVEEPLPAPLFCVHPQRAKEALLPAGMTEPLPAARFLSSLRGLTRSF